MKKLLGSLGACLLLLCFAFSARAEVITDWSPTTYNGITKWINELGEAGIARGGSTAGLTTVSTGTIYFDYMNGVPMASSADAAFYLNWGRGIRDYQKNIDISVSSFNYYSSGLPVPDGSRYPAELSLISQLSLWYLSGSKLIQIPTRYANLFDFNYLMGPGGESGIDADLFVLRNPENMVTRFEYEGTWYEYSYENLFTELTGMYAEWARDQLGLDAGAALYGMQFAHQANWASRIDLYPTVRLASDTPPVPTPEPSSLLLMSLGLLGSMALLRRGKARK